MYHFISYAVVTGTGMDEDAGSVAKLPATLVREHREEIDAGLDSLWGVSELGVRRFLLL
jgi:hypothetical protein